MKIKRKIGLGIVLLGLVASISWFLSTRNFDVLQPKGQIAEKQLDLIIFASLLSLIVVIPVFALTFFIAWRYRASNHKAKYSPDWDHNRYLETIWWGVPLLLILVLSVVTWRTSHELAPSKSLTAEKRPITIQVVAMEWKWLFIYPEQKIATVNYVEFPKQTPVKFEITSDAPMNSFWIPQLGGQIYAMTGMSTKLHLMANEEGEYNGVSANISGDGFADMRFIAKSSSEADFDKWVTTVKTSPTKLNSTEYAKLSVPSKKVPASFYSNVENDFYQTIVMKFNLPTLETGSKQPEKENDRADQNYSGGHH